MATKHLPNTFRSKYSIERVVRNKWFWTFFILLGFAYPLTRSLLRELPPQLPVLFELPTYSFTKESGEAFGSSQLAGKVYIANFFFTSCATVCEEMINRLQEGVQKRLRGVGEWVNIVSFTVDPETDTPEVLTRYKERKKIAGFWHFLTAPTAEVQSLLRDGFRVAMGERQKLENFDVYDIAHSQKVALVDHRGRIRGYYGTQTREETDRLMIDIGLLTNRIYFHQDI